MRRLFRLLQHFLGDPIPEGLGLRRFAADVQLMRLLGSARRQHVADDAQRRRLRDGEPLGACTLPTSVVSKLLVHLSFEVPGFGKDRKQIQLEVMALLQLSLACPRIVRPTDLHRATVMRININIVCKTEIMAETNR